MKESYLDKELEKIDEELKQITQENEEWDRKIRDKFNTISKQLKEIQNYMIL